MRLASALIMYQTKPEQVAEAFVFVTHVLKERGLTLIGLVCNAGLTEMGPVKGLDIAYFQALMDTNVMGGMRVIQLFCQNCEERKDVLSSLVRQTYPCRNKHTRPQQIMLCWE